MYFRRVTFRSYGKSWRTALHFEALNFDCALLFSKSILRCYGHACLLEVGQRQLSLLLQVQRLVGFFERAEDLAEPEQVARILTSRVPGDRNVPHIQLPLQVFGRPSGLLALEAERLQSWVHLDK